MESPERELSSGATVLVVEDDHVCLMVLCQLLDKSGYSVIMATNGEKARRLFEQPFDLMLLDTGLPDEDGIDLLKSFRAEYPHREDVAVICVSASDAIEDVEQALTNGAQDFLSKPYKESILLAKVATFVRYKRRLDQLRMQSDADAALRSG